MRLSGRKGKNMAVIYKSKDFVSKVKNIAQNYNTVYCWGSFGFPITEYNIKRLADDKNGYPKIYTAAVQTKLRSLIGKNYFGFDCVGLIKGVLWGFTGDASKPNGGTGYCSNGVRDMDCNDMFNLCSGQSTDFSSIVPGEFLGMQGHIGVYIGDGLAVEATASWNNKVQITAVANIGTKSGYNSRCWTKHGKSPFIDYSGAVSSSAATASGGTAYKTGKTNAPVNVRETASISGRIITKFPKGTEVKLTGKNVKNGGYTWAEILYNGKARYCDKQWVNC